MAATLTVPDDQGHRLSLPSLAPDVRSTPAGSKRPSCADIGLPTLHPELVNYTPGEFTLRVTSDVSKGLNAHMDRMKNKVTKNTQFRKRLESLNKSIMAFDDILQSKRKDKKYMKPQPHVKGDTDTLVPSKKCSFKQQRNISKRNGNPTLGKSDYCRSDDSFEPPTSDNILVQSRKRENRSLLKKNSMLQGDDIYSKSRVRRQHSYNDYPMPKLDTLCRRQSLVSISELEKYYEEPTVRFTKAGQAKHCFRKAVRRVMNLLFWWNEFSSKYATMESKMKTFLDFAEELTEHTNGQKHMQNGRGVRFDPRYYKASKDAGMTNEVLMILSTRPHQRTEQQIQKVICALQSLKSYSEYPLHMQEKLARVAFYHQVPPKRIVLRQGHRPENFYFILAGVAAVKVITHIEGIISVNVVARLEKGQSFGEIALLHDSVRTATVESVTSMKLLTVYRDDFLDIFFNMKNGEEPEYISFCREIPFLKDWPLDQLVGDVSNCVFHYFKRGSVVLPDSQKNDWIYIVKSGSCRVIKRLKEVDAYRPWQCGQSMENTCYQNKTNTIDFPAKVDSGIYKHRVLAVSSPLGRAMTDFFMTSMKMDLQGDFQKRKSKSSVSFKLDNDESESQDDFEQTDGITEETNPTTTITIDEIKTKTVPKSAEQRLSAKLSSPKIFRDISNTGDYDTPGFSKSQFSSFLNRFDPKRCSLPLIKKRPANYSAVSSEYTHSSKGGRSCYITLKKLRPKDVFGLEDVQFEDEQYDNPNVSVILVSDGAELVMISKQKFIEHANEFVRQYVREHVQFYPADDVLQRSLQTEVNWNLYRTETMDDTVRYLQDLRKCHYM